MNHITSVTIYCASSTQIDQCYVDAAHQLGALLAQKHIHIINGAGSIGLMRTVSDAALAHGGQVTGVIPSFMVEQGWHYQKLSELHITATMHERKQMMAELGNGAIALPGGCGTLEELLEIITWKQLGLYVYPIIILNTNGYFDYLIDMLNQAIDQRFMRHEHKALWQVADTPEEAVELLYTTPLWDKNMRKQAAL